MATRADRIARHARIRDFLMERQHERMPLSILRAVDVPTQLMPTRGEPYWSDILKFASSGDEVAIGAADLDLIRVERHSAVVRQRSDPGWVLQVTSREATNDKADLGRIGAIEAVCGILQSSLNIRAVGISDLAAAVVDHAENVEAMEKALRRLNRGETVTRIRLPSIDWDEIAFSHDTFRKPGAKRRRALERRRDKF